MAVLRRLQGAARSVSLSPQQPVRSVLNGRHRSRLRGRGLNFEEMRDYLPGDDIRAIDWKATARAGKPYVKVLTEERDRAVLLAVDQRMSMFFGSRHNMKSVTAAETAAILGHATLLQGDRVGGVVFNDDTITEFIPKRSNRALHAMLGEITCQNQALAANAAQQQGSGRLNDVLEKVARLAHHDTLVILISDCSGIDATTRRRLSGIANHNDLIVVLVDDPLAHNVAEDLPLVVSDGDLQAEVQFQEPRVREALLTYSEARLSAIHRWQQEINLSVMALSAGEETEAQIRTQLGYTSPAGRLR